MSEDQLDNLDVSGYTIRLPGKALDISAIVKAKKFKNRGINLVPWRPAKDSKMLGWVNWWSLESHVVQQW